MSATQNWYPVVDTFLTKYYEVITNIAREVDVARRYLGGSGFGRPIASNEVI